MSLRCSRSPCPWSSGGSRRNVKVLVLTTSYPRDAEDVAGCSCATRWSICARQGSTCAWSPSIVRALRLAYGDGILGNLRRRPWLALALPLFLLSFAPRGTRCRAGRGPRARALASVCPARARDEQAFRRPALGNRHRARPSGAMGFPLAPRTSARRPLSVGRPGRRRRGARRARRPCRAERGEDSAEVASPDEPAHVLFVGRLAAEKGVADFVRATEGLPRVIVGDGPLRDAVPGAIGFVPPQALGQFYERAAIVACPSHREGYGVVAREAMAHARAVVASAVGGLVDAVEDGVTGLLVPPRDPAGLRAAVERLLADSDLRRRLGDAGREKARAQLRGTRPRGRPSRPTGRRWPDRAEPISILVR